MQLTQNIPSPQLKIKRPITHDPKNWLHNPTAAQRTEECTQDVWSIALPWPNLAMPREATAYAIGEQTTCANHRALLKMGNGWLADGRWPRHRAAAISLIPTLLCDAGISQTDRHIQHQKSKDPCQVTSESGIPTKFFENEHWPRRRDANAMPVLHRFCIGRLLSWQRRPQRTASPSISISIATANRPGSCWQPRAANPEAAGTIDGISSRCINIGSSFRRSKLADAHIAA